MKAECIQGKHEGENSGHAKELRRESMGHCCLESLVGKEERSDRGGCSGNRDSAPSGWRFRRLEFVIGELRRRIVCGEVADIVE